MTVQTQSTRAVFQGDGSTRNFPFGFRIISEDHINVFLTNTTNSTLDSINPFQIKKLSASEFSVTVNRPQPGMGGPGTQENPGGEVTLDGFGAPSTGIKISIERATPDTQLTDYVPNDPFPANTHERALDKLTLIVQEIDRELDDVLVKAPPGESVDCPPLPIASERGGKLLGFNSNGCPTTVDFQNTNITAPMVWSDLTNVSVENASNRQVGSFNATTQEWTPEDNVFSVNDLHGDLEISTNKDGDLTLTDGNNTVIVAENTELTGSANLLKDFTLAEAINEKEPVAVRSNGEIENLKITVTSGQIGTVVTYDNDTSIFTGDMIYISSLEVFAIAYVDEAADTVNVRICTLNKVNEEIDQIGAEQTIATYSTGPGADTVALTYDTTNDRLCIFYGNPDSSPANQPTGHVLTVDSVNLTLSNIGSAVGLVSIANDAEIKEQSAEFHPTEGTVCYTWFDNFVADVQLVTAQVDTNNENFNNTTNTAITSRDEGFSGARMRYLPAEDVIGMVYADSSSNGTVWAIVFSLSGVTPTLSSEVTASTESGADGTPPPVQINDESRMMVLTWTSGINFNEGILGAVLSVSGASLSLDKGTQVVLEDTDAQSNFSFGKTDLFWAQGPDKWLWLGSSNDKIRGVTGTVSGDTIKADQTSIEDFSNDINAGASTLPTFWVDGPDFFVGAGENNSDQGFVYPGSIPTSTTNVNAWVGVMLPGQGGQAGDVRTVALRSSDAEVNPTLTPGKIYFLTRDGALTTTETNNRAGLATSTSNLLTAGVDFNVDGATSSTSGSAIQETIADSDDISSATSQIDIDISGAFTRILVEILELQCDNAGSGNNVIFRFSNDGGNTFISSTDYDYANLGRLPGNTIDTSNTGDDKLRLTEAPGNGGAEHANIRLVVTAANVSSLFTSTHAEGHYTAAPAPNEVTLITSAGVLRRAEVHDRLRVAVENANITRAKVRVRGLD